jgi:hypothetical protein
MTVHRVDTNPFEQIKDRSDELKNHSAFYSGLTEDRAKKILIGTKHRTYILWTMIGSDREVAHLIVSPYDAAALSELIAQKMQCQPNECKPLSNLCQNRKLEC